jgi:predicted transcriptional regulator
MVNTYNVTGSNHTNSSNVTIVRNHDEIERVVALMIESGYRTVTVTNKAETVNMVYGRVGL